MLSVWCARAPRQGGPSRLSWLSRAGARTVGTEVLIPNHRYAVGLKRLVSGELVLELDLEVEEVGERQRRPAQTTVEPMTAGVRAAFGRQARLEAGDEPMRPLVLQATDAQERGRHRLDDRAPAGDPAARGLSGGGVGTGAGGGRDHHVQSRQKGRSIPPARLLCPSPTLSCRSSWPEASPFGNQSTAHQTLKSLANVRRHLQCHDSTYYSRVITALQIARSVAKTPSPLTAAASKVSARRRLR